MRRPIGVAVAFVSFLLVAPMPLAGQDAPKTQSLPTVKVVMDRYVQAMGGRDAIFRHKSMTIRETIQVLGKDKSSERVFRLKDGKSSEYITLSDGRIYQSGYNGTVGWEIDPNSGPALAEGLLVKSIARDADMYYPAHILDYFSSMEVVDVAEFEGHTCYHLKGTNKWDKINEHFYDTSTGLLVGYRFNSAWRGGAGDEHEVFNDYKEFGGWLIPTRIEHKEPARTIVESVTSLTLDDVDDSAFTLPDSIKALLAKKPAKS